MCSAARPITDVIVCEEPAGTDAANVATPPDAPSEYAFVSDTMRSIVIAYSFGPAGRSHAIEPPCTRSSSTVRLKTSGIVIVRQGDTRSSA